jgi:hypothetical protein
MKKSRENLGLTRDGARSEEFLKISFSSQPFKFQTEQGNIILRLGIVAKIH